MDVEQLIEYVTDEVLKRLQVEINDKDQSIEILTKKKVLIIGEEEKVLYGCQKALEKDWDITVSNVYEVEGDYSSIILASADNDLLANGAIGTLGTRYKIIQDALMQGKEIYIIEEGILYRKYKETCHPSFYELLHSYEEKIKSFGMEVISLRDIGEKFNNDRDKVPQQYDMKPQKDIRDYRLITEQILGKEKARGIKKLYVHEGTLITPLARDYARQHHIAIISI